MSLIFTLDSRIIPQISINSISSIPRWSSHDHNQSLSHNRTRVVINQVTIITVDPRCDQLWTGPISVGAAIDRFNTHSAQVAHCTHTTEPMALNSYSGGPTTFRQNRPTAMTQPLRPTPLWDKSWVAQCLPKASTTTVVAKQKRSQMGTSRLQQLRAHKAYAVLPGQGSART